MFKKNARGKAIPIPSIVRYSLLAAFLFLGTACRHQQAQDMSTPKTDLLDNREVAAAFNAHKASLIHCPGAESFRDGTRRIIVTGFGLFGARFNISGIVAMSMARPGFWPDTASLATVRKGRARAFRHQDLQTRNGVHLQVRNLKIDDVSYQVCFLLLDVKWDLAAAIILHEAGLFKPDLVVMGGMNGREPTEVFFETGAVNEATLSSGFTAEGSRLPENIPAGGDTRVLQNLPADHLVNMTWDAPQLANATRPVVAAISRSINYTTKAAPVRRENDYICNNVSFAVTSGLTGTGIELAGGTIKIPAQNTGTKVGFIHYPYQSSAPGRADDSGQVFGWTKVVATVFRTALP